MDDLAHDPDQPVRRAIAIEDTARLEDRRGVLKGLSQAAAVCNVVEVESPASKTAQSCI
jgi:hypothetical protein